MTAFVASAGPAACSAGSLQPVSNGCGRRSSAGEGRFAESLARAVGASVQAGPEARDNTGPAGDTNRRLADEFVGLLQAMGLADGNPLGGMEQPPAESAGSLTEQAAGPAGMQTALQAVVQLLDMIGEKGEFSVLELNRALARLLAGLDRAGDGRPELETVRSLLRAQLSRTDALTPREFLVKLGEALAELAGAAPQDGQGGEKVGQGTGRAAGWTGREALLPEAGRNAEPTKTPVSPAEQTVQEAASGPAAAKPAIVQGQLPGKHSLMAAQNGKTAVAGVTGQAGPTVAGKEAAESLRTGEMTEGEGGTGMAGFKGTLPDGLTGADNGAGRAHWQEAGPGAKRIPGTEAGIKEDALDNGQQMTLRTEMTSSGQNPVQQAKSGEQPVYVARTAQAILGQIVQKAKTVVAPGFSEVQIQLKPDFLGKLNLSISSENGVITAKFNAETYQVKAIIETNLNMLRDALTQQGLKVDQLVVNVGTNSDYSAYRDREKPAFGQGTGRSGKHKADEVDFIERLAGGERETGAVHAYYGSTVDFRA